ncbi:hypothetical protein ACOSP7_029936 [Xanthoceras sorbifolium]
MAEIVLSIVAKVAELLVVPIGKHICYLFKYQSNMEELKQQVEKLTHARERVQHSVDEARRQGDEIENDVEKWLNSVDEFAEKAIKPIINDEDKAKDLCSIGFCSKFLTRYSLSKKAVKMAKDGVNLLGEEKFQKVSHCPAIGRTKSVYTRGYEDFGSRMLVFEKIMEALVDEDVNLIGVYGMGGVGKTTLVKRAVAQAMEDKLFDVVVMADVTETPNIKRIQGQIADELGLKFHEESLSGRAARLRNRLKKEKRALIVLDNIWAQLDLGVVGIPLVEEEKGSVTQEVEQDGTNDNKRQCKILLTSRDLHVLRDDMKTQKDFFVNVLSQEEAEHLFWKIVADSAKTFDFDSIAVEIIRCCAGLPVALATVANALKNKSLFEWNDALLQLRKSSSRHIRGMDANVYSAIKLSYDLLESEEAKSIFLLCSLYNASFNINIDYLLRYGMGLSLFQDVSTLEQGRNRLHTLINKLKASCLLLDGKTNKSVKMHDIVHAVSISIASTEKLMFNIQDITDLKAMLEEKLPKDSTAIALQYKDVSVLPERLECPKLKLLILLMKDTCLQLPDSFFEGMKELKVLYLKKIHMLSGPSSLCTLTNVRTLCLNQCLLRDITFIIALKRIEILSFWGSDIEQLPSDIRQLTRLRFLDLRSCSKLKVISPNVISSLTRLEELYVGNSFVQWDVEGGSNASLSELKQLSLLTTLDIRVLDTRIMPQDLLVFEKLERYRIIIGDVWKSRDKFESSRMLKLQLNNGNIYLGSGIKILLNRTEDLYLNELKGVKNVVYQLNGEGFPQLKHLYVENGPEIQYIISTIGWGLWNIFPKLESLFLHKLVNLEKIYHGRLAIESFNKLRIMKVEKCDRLKYLLSFSMAKNLMQLQEIEVTDCKMLEEIVFKESKEQVQQNDSRVELTKLRTLTIQFLPRLRSFGFNLFTPNTGSQEIIVEDDPSGSSFTSLFSQNVVLPSLENLKLSSINIGCTWFDMLPVMSSCCQALTNLTLKRCEGLKFLFSFSMVKSLVQLQKLEIRNSSTIEGIINTEALREEENMIKMVFPKLLTLHLEDLPKLAGFSSGNSVEFPSLTLLYVRSCPKLKTFLSDSMSAADIRLSKDAEEMNYRADMHPLFDKKVAFPCLKELSLVGLPELLHLWKEDSQRSTVFENLTNLDVRYCKNLKTLVPFSVSLEKLKTLTVWDCNGLTNLMTLSTAKTLVQLKTINIQSCKMLEEIIIDMRDAEIMTAEAEKDAAIDKITFSMLNSFRLWYLPNLTSFYSGSNTVECPSLTTIEITNCPKMETFVLPNTKDLSTRSASLFNEKVTLAVLASLKLFGIGIQTIWHKQLLAMSFMAESLAQLKVLEISNCEFIKGVIVTEELISTSPFPKLNQLKLQNLPELTRFCNFNGNSIELPSLSELEIQNCPKMQTFVSSSLFADMPAIKEPEEVKTRNEENLHSFFDEKVAFPCLKELILRELPELLHLWKEDSQRSTVFENLTNLDVRGCKNLKTLVPFSVSLEKLKNLLVSGCNGLMNLMTLSTAKTLVQLKTIHISSCEMLEEIIIDMRDEEIMTAEVEKDAAIDKITFSMLNSFLLRNLPNLISFYSGSNTLECPSLSKLWIENCPKMDTFVSNLLCADITASKKHEELNLKEDLHLDMRPFIDEKAISFCLQHLTELTLDGCDNFKYLFPSSMAESFVHLQVLKISNCKFMEGVIITQDNKKSSTLLPKLSQLELKNLPELTRFCNFNGNSIKLPSLSELEIKNCPKMQTFVSNSIFAVMPATEEPEEVNMQNENFHSFFDEKVTFPCLKDLKLRELPKLLHLWKEGSQHSIIFENLTNLDVSDCENLKTLVPSSVSLQKLMTLTLQRCNGLMNLLTLSSAKTLVQLESLDIECCKLVEEIITDKGDEETKTAEGEIDVSVDKIAFRMLDSIILESLPNLISFYSGSNILECPSLTIISVEDCPKMKTLVFPKDISIYSASFFSEQATSSCFQNLTELIMDGYDSVKYVFPSSVAESFVHLKVFKISNCKHMEGIIIIEEERINSTLFPELKQLTLKDLSELKRFCNFKGDSVELPSLSELEIQNCPKMKTFASDSVCGDMPAIEEPKEGNTEETIHSFFDEKVAFPCLNKLVLCELPELLHLWKGNSQPSKVIENLAHLKVSGCGNLVTLVPSSVSLQNLERLEVQKCDGLINLVTFSMAKTLEKLKIMKIVDCKTIEEIIVDVGDEIKDVIVFNQLKYLKLRCLPSLTNFCKGNFTIEFPYLQRVLVIECLKMMTFSQGVLSTPKLQRIHLKEEEVEWHWELSVGIYGLEDKVDGGCWEGDLNTTIQKLFKDVHLLQLI